ncbi:hypothetical protein D9611_012382 [Ephemerocybe angulata]|uniref:Uncharacterized protein n=1 Tax=Ephemerocybe angulata TaxID=980116 RepID=A0A8H5FKT4_9AGAR|nr:hypothetical protein D9611_012382 [Tulosesus angulatus]
MAYAEDVARGTKSIEEYAYDVAIGVWSRCWSRSRSKKWRRRAGVGRGAGYGCDGRLERGRESPGACGSHRFLALSFCIVVPIHNPTTTTSSFGIFARPTPMYIMDKRPTLTFALDIPIHLCSLVTRSRPSALPRLTEYLPPQDSNGTGITQCRSTNGLAAWDQKGWEEGGTDGLLSMMRIMDLSPGEGLVRSSSSAQMSSPATSTSTTSNSQRQRQRQREEQSSNCDVDASLRTFEEQVVHPPCSPLLPRR